MSLIGTLDELKIGDVLRVFSEGHKSGVLTATAGTHQAVLRMHKGLIVHASAGRLQGEEAVLDLFGWKEGQLGFIPEDKPPAVAANVHRDVTTLVAEGQRVGESLHRIHTLIPSDRVVFQLALGPADEAVKTSIGGTEWRVIRLLDGVRDVKAVIEASGVARPEVHRVLCDLTDAGFLQRVEVQKVLRAYAQTGLFARETAEVDERLRDEWTRTARFDAGVARVQVRTMTGRSAVVPTSFRSSLDRDIHLPKDVMDELGLREGDDVHVRPMA